MGSVSREAQSVISSSAPKTIPPSPIPSTTEIGVASAKLLSQIRRRPEQHAKFSTVFDEFYEYLEVVKPHAFCVEEIEEFRQRKTPDDPTYLDILFVR